MLKKIKTAIIFLALNFVSYIVFSIIYNRSMLDLNEVLLFYAIIALLVFFISVQKRRLMRRGLVLFVFILPATYAIFTTPADSLITSSELLLHTHKTNAPFLPIIQFKLSNENYRLFIEYLLFFILPIVYYYLLYCLSKILGRYNLTK